jgi:formylglycine-generating enzyme required for sulfatase activity
MDLYEYPNQEGQKPLLGVNWDEAVALCLAQGKRLCSAEEWTLACEGPGRLPYPYGYARDSAACNIDKPYRFPDNQLYANLQTRAEEMARLDQREPSGSRAACVSGYGVFDMTGNADEWVLLQRGSHQKAPYRSALKGGYWGPVRNRCRPITATHNRWHSGYQIGLRCCRDIEANTP